MSYVKGSQLPSTSTVADTDTLIVTQEGDSKATKKVAKSDLLKEDRTRLTNLEIDNTTNKNNITNLQNDKAEKNHNHDNSYLKLSGGNLTGELGLNNSKPIRVKDSNGNYKYLIGMGDSNVVWLGNADNKLTIQSDERVLFKKANNNEHYAAIQVSEDSSKALFGDITAGANALNSYISVSPTQLQYCKGNSSYQYDIYHSGNFNPSNYALKSELDSLKKQLLETQSALVETQYDSLINDN